MATRQEREERKTQILSNTKLVELVGSEKQIGWATKIRETKLDDVAQGLAVFQLGGDRDVADAEYQHKVLSHLAGIADSSWWIQIRDCTDLDNPLFWAKERTHKLGA